VTPLVAPTVEGDPRGQEQWISLVRVLLLLTLIPASWVGIVPVDRPAVNGAIVLLGGYVLLLAVGPRRLAVLRKTDLVVALDILVITGLLLISGALGSPFLYLYYLVILEAAVRMNLRQALAASLATAGVLILLWTRAGQGAALETIGFRLGAFIAGGFFLALFLGMLVQETRAARERSRWAALLDQRLQEATRQLEEQLTELQFYNELASRLSGELRVEGVLEILLRVFVETIGASRGVAYVYGDDGQPYTAVTTGFPWTERSQVPEPAALPPLPDHAAGGDIVVQPLDPGEAGASRVLTCIPLVRAGHLRAWLCGLGDAGPQSQADVLRRRLHGLAAQGVSALEAARLHEEVQRMVSVDPTKSLYPWNGLPQLVAEEIQRSAGLLFVFSIAEVHLGDYALDATVNAGVNESNRDLAVRRVLTLLQGPLRRIDVLTHDGAGRFVLLLPRVPKLRAVELVRGAVDRLAEDPVLTQVLSVDRLLLSAAVVTFPEDGTTAPALLDRVRELLAEGPAYPPQVRVPAGAS